MLVCTYVAAIMTSIAYGEDSCYLSYNLKTMQGHLAKCFEQQHLKPFQSSPRVVSKVERTFYNFDVSSSLYVCNDVTVFT